MHNGVIPSPDQVAAKLCAIAEKRAPRLAEQFRTVPRLAEALWFFEYHARQPGGIEAVCRDLVSYADKRILPPEFQKLPIADDGFFSVEDALRVWAWLPTWSRPRRPKHLGEVIDFIDSGIVWSGTPDDWGSNFCEDWKTGFRQWLSPS